jgi:hypothetical protein
VTTIKLSANVTPAIRADICSKLNPSLFTALGCGLALKATKEIGVVTFTDIIPAQYETIIATIRRSFLPVKVNVEIKTTTTATGRRLLAEAGATVTAVSDADADLARANQKTVASAVVVLQSENLVIKSSSETPQQQTELVLINLRPETTQVAVQESAQIIEDVTVDTSTVVTAATPSPTTLSPVTGAPTTKVPTLQPTTKVPTMQPTTKVPTTQPTTKQPTRAPTKMPTVVTSAPTSAPTPQPTISWQSRFLF